MAIVVSCTCGARFRCKAEHAGKRVKCPNCGAVQHIPEQPPAPSEATSVAPNDQVPADLADPSAPGEIEHRAHTPSTGESSIQSAIHELEHEEVAGQQPAGDAESEKVATTEKPHEQAPESVTPPPTVVEPSALSPPPPMPAAAAPAAMATTGESPGQTGVASADQSGVAWHKPPKKKKAVRKEEPKRPSKWKRLRESIPRTWIRRGKYVVMALLGITAAWYGVDYLLNADPFGRRYVELPELAQNPEEADPEKPRPELTPTLPESTPNDDQQGTVESEENATEEAPTKTSELNPIREVRIFTGMDGPVLTLLVTDDGSKVIAADNTGKLCIWDRYTGDLLNEFQMQMPGYLGDGAIAGLDVTQDGHTAMYSDNGQVITLWREAQSSTPNVLMGHTEGKALVAISPDDKRAVTATGQTAYVWRLPDGRRLLRLGLGRESLSAVAFSPDSSQVLLGSRGVHLDAKTIDTSRCAARIWNAETGEPGQTFTGHTGPISSVAWSKDGERIVTSSSDDLTVRTWHAETGSQLRRFVMTSDPAYRAIFSPDGNYVLTANASDTMQLWLVANGQRVCHLLGSSGPITSMTFTPNGRFVVGGGMDRGVRMWELPTTGK